MKKKNGEERKEREIAFSSVAERISESSPLVRCESGASILGYGVFWSEVAMGARG
jgi:hypothetical protein